MIRIDLGKSESQKKAASKSLSSSLKLPENFKLPQVQMDMKGLLLIGVVTAFAGLPHLFVMQYKSYAESQHELVLKSFEEKENALKQEVAKYNSYKREMESYEKQKQLVKDRLEIVRRLLATRSTPVNILDAIGQSLPVRAWLTSIKFKVAAGQTEPGITLMGLAFANEDVSDYIDKLSESINLADVNLEYVNATKEKDIDIKQFQVTAMAKSLQDELAKRNTSSTPSAATPPAGSPNPGQAPENH